MTTPYGAPPPNPYLLMGGYGAKIPNPLEQALSLPNSMVPQIASPVQSVLPPEIDPSGFQMPALGGVTDLVNPNPGITQMLNKTAAAPTNTWGGMLGTTNADGVRTDGWGGMAMGAVTGAVNTFMGMQQYGMAKKQLAEGQRQYDKNYAAQRSTTNASLEDRQAARVASNPGGYESVGSYMNKNGIK